MKLQSKNSNGLLKLLDSTDDKVTILVIESVNYINVIRSVMPNSEITVVVNDDTLIDNRLYEDLGVNWICADYLFKILPIKPESIDIIIGDDLFLKSNNPLNTARYFASYLSETGYLVTSFTNALYWQIVKGMMEGHFYHSFDRIFTPIDFADMLGKASFKDVVFMPELNCTDTDSEFVNQLVSAGFNNNFDTLSVQNWCVRAAKFKADEMAFRRRYGKKMRLKLIKRLRRIEYGIQPLDNTAAIFNIMDKEALQPSFIAKCIFRNINYIGDFISNFIIWFYQTGRVKTLRGILDVVAEMYQEDDDFDTVIEWKRCVDALNEYPDELLTCPEPNPCDKNDNIDVAPDRKVAFIACINDEEWYDEWKLFIKSIIVPDGMTVELVPIRGAKSMCQGYNMGMKQTNAKYKIYLHQDVLISNKNIIEDVLSIFADKTVGAIGVIGTQKLPPTGIWWDTQLPIGSVLLLKESEEIVNIQSSIDYELCIDAEAVDGLMIATQVDIEWREDLFNGWHFYDIAQCKEMQRHGYRVVVAKQNQYWCMHYSSSKMVDDSYEKYRRIFIREYGLRMYHQ